MTATRIALALAVLTAALMAQERQVTPDKPVPDYRIQMQSVTFDPLVSLPPVAENLRPSRPCILSSSNAR